MIVIGSSAIKHWFPDFTREPKDNDFAVKEKSLQKTTRFGKIIVEYLYNPILFKYSKVKTLGYLEPDLLLTLKVSHLFWDKGDFDKHVWDIQFLLDKGCKFNKELFYELYEFWTSYFGQPKRSNLAMTKEDFFNNALKEFDHDELHPLVKNPPTYVSMLKDGEEVELDEEKWNKASFEDKCNLIKEENYVMAFERFRKLDVSRAYLHRHAYAKMFKKYIIGHIPIYMIFFAMENYKTLCKPDYDFIKVIEDKL